MAIALNPSKISMEDDEDCMFALQLVSSCVLPMTLKTALELDLLEIIAKGGTGAHFSPAQIASHLPTQNPDAPTMIDRILRLLASYSILTSSLHTHGDGHVETHYGLAPVCKFLTRNENGVSLAPFMAALQGKVFMESWYQLKDAVIEGGCPFKKAHGMNVFEYPAIDPSFNEVLNRGMSNPTTIIMGKILETYTGFQGLKEVADVGGGVGSTLQMIVSKYPNLKGLNFDLPHVVAEAPAYPGVEHVGGDMFVSVPSAEAIFMKWILHDWSDEQCMKLLKNCLKALPDFGKFRVSFLNLDLFHYVLDKEMSLPWMRMPDEAYTYKAVEGRKLMNAREVYRIGAYLIQSGALVLLAEV
ncbi:hypothetical protein MRB53_019537 [Persea americana]|uniref:Uncharacterized protein n=1 Tax=Persea americana TaxID=3435 RepID=A0ACC2KYT0_PERAE|nr:hypothetical protein MRB53_019537 [Persea americana]